MEQLIERLMKAPPAAKYGGLAGVVIVLTALNFFLVISPIEEKITSQEAKYRQLETQLAEKQDIAQNLNERRRGMDLLEQELAKALIELPEKKDVDELLTHLSDIGKKSGLEISSVEPGPESPASFYARIPLKMSVAGNYHEIAIFMQEVANMRRIVNVNNIHLSNPTKKGEKLLLKSEFLATTFRFLDPNSNQGDKKGAKKGAKQ